MAHIYIDPPTMEEMLDTVVQWMAHHSRTKITVRIDYQDGTGQTTELDYRELARKMIGEQV